MQIDILFIDFQNKAWFNIYWKSNIHEKWQNFRVFALQKFQGRVYTMLDNVFRQAQKVTQITKI